MKDDTKDAYSYFMRALQRFEEALAEDQSNPLAIDGSIQRFEFCFELGWKLIKKMSLDVEGVEVLSPKKALQSAYQFGWIEDEQAWLSMLNDRNLTSHTYREEYAKEIYSHLPAHLSYMKLLQAQFKELMDCS